MERVSFDEEQEMRQTIRKEQVSGLTAWVVKNKIAKDAAQATIIMTIIAIAAFVAAILVFVLSAKSPNLTPEQERLDAWMQQGGVGVPPASFNP